jgi:hypothetical protein
MCTPYGEVSTTLIESAPVYGESGTETVTLSVCEPPFSTTRGTFAVTSEKPGVATETDWTVHEEG